MISFLTYHAVPDVNHSDYGQINGAYINCWIEASDLEKAKMISRKTIEDLKWAILSLEDAYPISLSDFAPGSEGKEFHEQALIDKEVYQIHTYTE
ncbi:MAG TPA: hypothetical protein VK772_03795 [Puia sp.]|jgi:hypothetical protein|nr:hypothetical protein [Puia sp.]